MEKEKNVEFARIEAIGLFTRVRDVPYKLGLDGNPAKLFLENRGNCVRKILYFAPKLSRLGYEVTGLGVAVFDWREFDIPGEIISKLKNPIDTHAFLYAKNLSGKEISLDPAWDLKMPNGFPKSIWDGENATDIGVNPISLSRKNLDIFKIRALLSVAAERTRAIAHLKGRTPFNDAFNNWLGR